MSRKLLLSIIIALIITNVATLLFWNKNEESHKGNGNIILDDDQTEVSSSDAVAKIGKEEVSYEAWIESMRKSYGERHLKSMIDRSVVNQLSKKENIQIDEKVINRELSFLASMQGVMTKEEIEKQEASWREDIIYRYELEALLTKDVKIPEDQSRAYYNDYKNQYNFDTSIQSSHIIVDTFDIAEKVIKELEQGASFDLLAQEYSTDEETKDDGGYLGFLIESSQFFPRGYKDVASELAEDSYSEPFNAGNGIAILYLHRKLPEITFSYEEIKPYIENELALNEKEQSLTANPLWDQLDIDWLYGKD